ncbi:gamma-glutamylcyclotransferase family protein [Oceaniglobus indicus]|uniref:gamma-glutamylcyclotransferase family protein n=1 Tax=Oceaniglobus indicus TaxID=2047749 RepID=UPI000C181539|nr:gamma-glutamylcyclotransferase family protein [Oceaniglobus indicus]
MNDPLFFGYGSLVNRATHGYLNGRPARLTGWRREWRHTQFSQSAFLTAVPSAGDTIDGLVAEVPGANWQALDLRERGYDRVSSDAVDVLASRLPEVAVYSMPPERHAAPTEPRPILLSYVDVVVQGFYREYGPDGVARFFATTDGWHAPILNDRTRPIYPRHQTLSADETALVDGHLAQTGVQIVAA